MRKPHHNLSQSLRNESGFSIIELLVVAVIVGILAAIAIPVFLSQQTEARDTAARSDLRNATAAEHEWAASHSGFTSNVNNLEAGSFRQSPRVSFPVIEAPASDPANGGFCIQGKHDLSSNSFYVSEGSGGVKAGTC